MFCSQCGLRQPDEHRFCMSCGARVPRELLTRTGPKVTRWFWGMPVVPSDPTQAALRVSRYLESVEVRTADGSARVPSHHVRFSIWHEDRAVCAVSIPDDEAASLAAFLQAHVTNGHEVPAEA
jgi:zinc ribbon protein